MDLQALSSIEGFTATSLLLTTAICLLAVFISWYTVRSRIQVSQVILGIFGFVLVMLLENVFTVLGGNLHVPDSGPVCAVYLILSIVLSREIVRFLIMKFALCDRFQDTDAAIGFGLGFAGLYLFTCASYYFSCYSAVNEFLSSGAEEFFANAGTDSQEAYDLLATIATQSGWEYLLTGVNRAFFLVREIALSVLLWYGFTNENMRRCMILVPVLHAIAMIPEGLYGASILESSYAKDILTYILSGGIAFIAAKTYNARENQVAHFKVEKLRARRKR